MNKGVTGRKVLKMKIVSGGATPNDATARLPGNLSEFINNPNIINMASQVLSDSNFHSMLVSKALYISIRDSVFENTFLCCFEY